MNFTRVLSYSFLALGSFFLFLYLTFPFEVVKEGVVIELSKALGMPVQMKSLRPTLPLGVKAEEVSVSIPGSKHLGFSVVEANVSLLRLFLGKLAVAVEIEDKNGGQLVGAIHYPLLQMILGEVALPSAVQLQAKGFAFGNLADFALGHLIQGKGVNPLLRPILVELDIDGKLDAEIDLSLDADDHRLSSGDLELSLVDLALLMGGDGKLMPDQRFTKALVKGQLSAGELILDESSGFVSSDLTISLRGKLAQKEQLLNSQLDLTLGIEMGKALSERFGMILGALSQGRVSDSLNLRIFGGISEGPQISIL